MKNLLLALLLIVAIGFNSYATTDFNYESSTENTVTKSKVNTFCKLIQDGDIDGVKNLINTGTDINRKSVGLTPLMYAARQNKTEIVKLLIFRGAKLKIKSSHGYTALDYAKISKATESYDLIKAALES